MKKMSAAEFLAGSENWELGISHKPGDEIGDCVGWLDDAVKTAMRAAVDDDIELAETEVRAYLMERVRLATL